MSRSLALLAPPCCPARARARLPALDAPLDNRLLDSFVRSHAARSRPTRTSCWSTSTRRAWSRWRRRPGAGPGRAWCTPTCSRASPRRSRAPSCSTSCSPSPTGSARRTTRVRRDRRAAPATLSSRCCACPRSATKGARIADVAGCSACSGGGCRSRGACRAGAAARPAAEHWRVGLINFTEDPDGVGRRYLLRETVGGWRIPRCPRASPRPRLPGAGRGRLVLAWRGRANAFPRVSFSDLYEEFDRSARKRPADEFAGKIVIIGTAATGLHDLRVTPIDSLHPAPRSSAPRSRT